MTTRKYTIQPNEAVATQIVWANSGPQLITNNSSSNIFIGNNNAIKFTDQSDVATIGPLGSIAVDGTNNFYAITDSTSPVIVTTIAGGLSISSVVQLTTNNVINGAGVIIAPSGDATGATDLNQIQSVLNLGIAAMLENGTYYVNSTIEIPVGGVLVGTGRGQVDANNQTVILATTTMPAVVASKGWIEGTNTTTQGGINVRNLCINANNLATHCLVSQNYSSLFENVYARYPISQCFRLDGVSQNGAVSIVGSGVNNQFIRCLGQNCVTAYATNDPNQIFTDGFIVDSFAINCSGNAIGIVFGAGWKIDGNHLYGLQSSGIAINNLFATRIVNNYIEAWGQSAASGFYSAIGAGSIADGGPGSVIANNTLNLGHAPGNAGSTMRGISLQTNGGFTADVIITGNEAQCSPAATAFAFAYACAIQTLGAGAVMNIVSTGNNYTGNWTTKVAQFPASGSTITVTAGN